MKKIFNNSFLYAIGNSANSVALLVIIPYLINKLTTTEYGAWTIFDISIYFLNLIILAGIDIGLMREYWFLSDEAKRAQLVGSTLIIVGTIGATIVAGGTSITMISGVNFGLAGAPYTIYIALVLAWSEALFTILLTLFRIREQVFTFIGLAFGRLLLFAILLLGFIESGWGMIGALGARLLASLLILGISFVLGWRWISWHFDHAKIRRIVSYGLPMLPANVAAYVLLAADRYFIQVFLSLEAVAIYSFAYKIATVVDILITRPFATDWAPRRFKIATQPKPELHYTQALLFYLWFMIGGSLALTALTPLLYSLLAPPAYWSAMDIVPVILLAYIIYGLSYPLNIGIMLKDRTRDLPLIGWIAAACCLGLYIWWIPSFGIVGAAWATVAAYTIWTGLIALDSFRLYPLPYPWTVIGSILCVGAITYGGLWISAQWWPTTHLLIVGLQLSWVVILMGGCGFWLRRYMDRKYESLVG